MTTKARKPKAAIAKAEEDGTRDKILNVAIQEFSRYGLSGARIDAIAAESGANKGMIYYYFGGKDDLYVAALEESYRRFRQIESEFHIDDLPPVPALRRLVSATFDYHAVHPEFIRMVMSENINQGEYIRKIPELQAINRPAIGLLDNLCQRGIAEGVFRADLDPVDLHMSISALSFYNVSNRYTFSYIFDRDLASKKVHEARRESVIDMILRYVRAP
ncbi:TetR family transcriptional regulator [Massilia terrae]|uniref:TetR family transcriptional regulator n=1 Tax=Massilia terrae TaxID=1811224 RepID=A0ABT2CS51_9BURK|nr:TetR family transcriptional regulator [Massilia terrae]MCS0656791.1 TetR family transcriptional regulator [Massilia terrae]